MSSQKHSMSIYTVMLILSMIFMFLANLLMIAEWLRWRDTSPKAFAPNSPVLVIHQSVSSSTPASVS